MRTRWILLFFLLMITTGACSSAPIAAEVPSAMPTLEAKISPTKETPETKNPMVPTQKGPTQMFQAMPTPLSDAMQNLIDKAKEHLADRLSISIDEVNFIGVYAVTWPDASLGCPQEGKMYAQVLTPGYLIQLESGANPYEYHSGKDTEMTYCASPIQPFPGMPDSY